MPLNKRNQTKPNQTKHILYNIYKDDLALNNLWRLICHKLNQIKPRCWEDYAVHVKFPQHFLFKVETE